MKKSKKNKRKKLRNSYENVRGKVENAIDTLNMEASWGTKCGEAEDIEQRRSNRLSAVLAIVVVIGTMCTILFRVCVKALNIWAVGDIAYICVELGIFLCLSILIIMIIQVIIFVGTDLKRYDVLNEEHRKYDLKSDKCYNRCIRTGITYLIFLSIAIVIVEIIIYLNGETIQKVLGMCMGAASIFCAVACIYFSIKKHGKRIFSYLKTIFVEVIIVFGVGFLCLGVAFISLTKARGSFRVDFPVSGKIEMSNKATRSLDNISFAIYNDSGKKIFDANIESSDMLCAIERIDMSDLDHNSIVRGSMLLNTELKHCRYCFDISNIIAEEGKYYMYVEMNIGNRKIRFSNDFIKGKSGFEYAVTNFMKEY